MSEKIKVWNWQRVVSEGSSADWVYHLLMMKQITCVGDDGNSVKILEGKNAGDIANVGDYLVCFCPPHQDVFEIRAVKKDDFEANYERMT